jgi:hypothetical protein
MHMAGGGCTGGVGGMHVHPVHPPWVRPCWYVLDPLRRMAASRYGIMLVCP